MNQVPACRALAKPERGLLRRVWRWLCRPPLAAEPILCCSWCHRPIAAYVVRTERPVVCCVRNPVFVRRFMDDGSGYLYSDCREVECKRYVVFPSSL